MNLYPVVNASAELPPDDIDPKLINEIPPDEAATGNRSAKSNKMRFTNLVSNTTDMCAGCCEHGVNRERHIAIPESALQPRTNNHSTFAEIRK